MKVQLTLFLSSVFLLLHIPIPVIALRVPVCVATKYECDDALLPANMDPPTCMLRTIRADLECGDSAADGCVECTSKRVHESNVGFLCGATTSQASTQAPNVYYAADDCVSMFVNGVRHGDYLQHWYLFGAQAVALRGGDVVAFVATDHGVWGGMAAAVNDGGWTGTGADDEWRALKATEYTGARNAWMMPSYDACDWPKPVVLPREDEVFPGKATHFPYAQTGAKYVWAEESTLHDTIFVRRVIGGKC